jgi:hypothetical protein
MLKEYNDERGLKSGRRETIIYTLDMSTKVDHEGTCSLSLEALSRHELAASKFKATMTITLLVI